MPRKIERAESPQDIERTESPQKHTLWQVGEISAADYELIDFLFRRYDIEARKVKADILDKSEGNVGAARVLCLLFTESESAYRSVVPQLGTGPKIWELYADECGHDITCLIDKFGD